MAELFLAQQPPKAELVVLKRILPYLSEEPEFVQMFLDEAKIAAQLHHPNIVQVYELGKLDNTIFIAMEFVEGIDLRRVMQEEQKFGATVPYGVAAAICAQVAAGLDYAHNSVAVDGRPLDLIHRDVSPQNVMIAYDGRVKLVDFGIAKAGAFIDARSKPGVIKGKFLYLSPEQVAQLVLDRRADIFALGTMMYEITTGKSPFAKPTTEGILYAIRSEDPSPPHLIKDDYPQELSRIIMRCLVKDRDQRYQHAMDVADDLMAFVNSGVIKQSTDIAEYIARLMGEEEERTVLHIPVATPAGRKDATLAMPAGLTGRPARRPSGEGHSVPPAYNGEPEPPTQMGRPRQLSITRSERVEITGQGRAFEGEDEAEGDEVDPGELEDALREVPEEPVGELDTSYNTGDVARYTEEEDPENDPALRTGPGKEPDFEEEEPDESTAVGGFPSGFVKPVPGESTVAERARGRGGLAPGGPPALQPSRRVSPPPDRDTEPRARRPATPPARRPLMESSPSISLTQPTGNGLGLEGDDERGESVSVTPATQSHRPVARQFSKPLAREEDSLIDTESGMGSPAPTARSRAFARDPDDDESTAGYEHETEEPAPSRGSRGLVLAAVAVLVLVILGAVAFFALSSITSKPADDGVGPPPPAPIENPDAQKPPEGESAAKPPDITVDEAVVKAPSPPQPEASPTPGPEVAVANPPSETTARPENSSPDNSLTPDLIAAGPEQPSTKTELTPPPQPPAANPGSNPNPNPKPGPTQPIKGIGVPVKFKTASATATVWVDGLKVDTNKVHYLAAGRIKVRWACSTYKRGNKGSFITVLKEGSDEPRDFSIPCRKGQR
jgi:serine/threonine-protein kinase